jgi:hypothetical protein
MAVRLSLILRLLWEVFARLALPLLRLLRTCNVPRFRSMSSYLSPRASPRRRPQVKARTYRASNLSPWQYLTAA